MQVHFYVSPEGCDTWSGRSDVPNASGTDGPFATLERARDAVRAYRRRGMEEGGVVVELRSGVYELDRAFVLSAGDSGREGAPVVYCARRGEAVRLRGGRTVAGFAPVTDPAVRGRLDPVARDRVLRVDLRALGITDYGEAGGGGLELFFADRPYVAFKDNVVGDDVGFVMPPPRGFRLRDDTPAYALGFRPIPLEKIGVYADERRASWPVSCDP